MKVSVSWLRTLIHFNQNIDQLANQLTFAGLEVESIENYDENLSDIQVGEVRKVEPHADRPNLTVYQIATAKDDLTQIVSEANNLSIGDKVACVLQGNRLLGKLVETCEIKGVVSNGMLCHQGHLTKLTQDSIGQEALILEGSLVIGEKVEQYLDKSDSVIELAITPNRGDCLSIFGVAREVAALNGKQAPKFDALLAKPSKFSANLGRSPISVSNSGKSACKAYYGCVVKNIDWSIQTPLWMRMRLWACGLKSINIVVDITNYIMLLTGQPMHAFDLEQLSGNSIEVRYAKKHESLTVLGGDTLELDENILVIADKEKAIALAGVLGGRDSSVVAPNEKGKTERESTSHIFLESAHFDPNAVAQIGRRYNINTDAAYRFERGVDPSNTKKALEYAVSLLQEIGCSKEASELVEVVDTSKLKELSDKTIALSHHRLCAALGIQLARTDVENILKRLGMKVYKVDADNWNIQRGSHRQDINYEVDLFEEICRVYGYEHIPEMSLPGNLSFPKFAGSKLTKEQKLKRICVSLGYNETVSYSFVDPNIQKTFLEDSKYNTQIYLDNPMSIERSVMRTMILPSLVNTLDYNIRRQTKNARLFEIGACFKLSGNTVIQQYQVLAGIAFGMSEPNAWLNGKRESLDFYDMKEHVTMLLDAIGIREGISYLPGSLPNFHSGKTALIQLNGNNVGYLGALHPTLAKERDWLTTVWGFELFLDQLEVDRQHVKYTPISTVPSINRDLSVWFPVDVQAADVTKAILAIEETNLIECELFDVYQSEKNGIKQKSFAISLTFRDLSSTLHESKIQEQLYRIIAMLEERFCGILRE